MTKRRILLLLGLAGVLACTPDPAAQAPPVPSASSTAAPAGGLPSALATPGDSAPVPNAERQQPLRALGACNEPPQPVAGGDVPGLVLPDGAVVTQVSSADPLTNVTGYVSMTPVQARAFYQLHPDLTIISVEDEGFEAEVLYQVDNWRVFVKSQAVCELGSVFVAVVSPATP